MADAGGLRLRGLGVRLPVAGPEWVSVLHDVDLDASAGCLTVLLGESGAGKTTLLAALLGLLPDGSQVRGRATWQENAASPPVDLLDLDPDTRNRWRGGVVAYLPQNPLTAFTPVVSVGAHLREVADVHLGAAATTRLREEVLPRFGVEPAWLPLLPHQLSGGQAQRVANAVSLLGEPSLVLADEPTTGLDAAQVERTSAVLRGLADSGACVLVVTHDLRLASRIADHAAVLLEGRTVEQGPVAEVLGAPEHPYTAQLLAALPGGWGAVRC